MKKHIKKVVSVLALAAVGALFVGCSKTVEKSAGSFDEFEYDYVQNTLKVTPPESDNMTVDGNLDEAAWHSANWLTHFDSDANVNMRFTTYFTDSGVYFAAVAEDWRIYTVKPFSDYNSGFKMYLAKKDDYALNSRVAVIISPDGNCYSYGLSSYTAKITTQYESDGVTPKGITAEMFLPWVNLGYEKDDEKPQSVRGFCEYMLSSNTTVATATYIRPGYGNGGSYGKYYDFTANGYDGKDGEDAVLGDSASGLSKGPDWDISQAESNEFSSNKGKQHKTSIGQSYLFYKNVKDKNYKISATFVPNCKEGTKDCGIGSSEPRVGLMGACLAETQFAGLLVDFTSKNIANKRLVLTAGETAAGSTNWSVVYEHPTEVDIAKGVKLICYKYGSCFSYYYDDGQTEHHVYTTSLNAYVNETEPGIWSSNCDVTVKNAAPEHYNIADDKFRAALNSEGLNFLSAEQAQGGEVTLGAELVKSGSSVSMRIAPQSGLFKLAKFYSQEEGGQKQDITADVKEKMNNGVYTVQNVAKNLKFSCEFARVEDSNRHKVTGRITEEGADGAGLSGVSIAAQGKTDKSMYYTAVTSSSGNYTFTLPDGEYTVFVSGKGYLKASGELTVSADSTFDRALSPSSLGGIVVVNETTLVSSDKRVDYSDADNGSVTIDATGRTEETVWLSGLKAISGDFVVTAVFDYRNGIDADPSAGFFINDGKHHIMIFALAGEGTGYRIMYDSNFDNRKQHRNYASKIKFEAATKVIVTLKRENGVYKFYSDMYDGTQQQATTERFALRAGEDIIGMTNSAFKLPTGDIAVGLAAYANNSFKITLLQAEKS